MNREIPLFFAVDENYAPFLAVALRSAAAHADPARRYRAIVLYEGLTDATAARLRALGTDNFTVELTPMRANFAALDDRIGNCLRSEHFTLTIFFRLFIPAMFPQYDKGVYIDSDVVLTADVAELFDTDIGDALLGACRDASIVDVPPLVSYIENAIGVDLAEYVNSGVLLLNLKEMRRCRFEEHFLRLLSTYHVDSIAPDQDYINAMCNGRIHYLDAAWDAMPNEAREPLRETKLVHYNLFSKPWCYDGVQYEDAFWAHAPESGFWEEILAYKAGFTEQKKEAERACLANMIRRSEEIPRHPVTFKKLHEQGVRVRI